MKRHFFGLILRSSATLFLIAAVFASTTMPAHAGIPVNDAANLKTNVLTYVEDAITSAQQYASTILQYKDFANTFDVANLAGSLTGSLQDKIMGFVQSGGENGGPLFVTDWAQYFQKESGEANKDFTSALGQTKICDQFRGKVLKSLGASTDPNPDGNGSVNSQLNCDFPSGKLADIKADPRNGTWGDYLKSAEPQNNALGAYRLASEAQMQTLSDFDEAAKSEAIAGGGFLSTKKDGLITMPGSVTEKLTAQAAGADFGLIAGADQLKDIAGMVSGGLITELTSGSADKGISGVNLAARRAQRNRTRDASGRRIDSDKLTPNCLEIFAQSLTAQQLSLFDKQPTGNPDGKLNQQEVNDALKSGVADVDFSLYDFCKDGEDIQTASKSPGTNALVAAVDAKRTKAQENFDELITKVKKTRTSLGGYPNAKKKITYKIDNPGTYDPTSSEKTEQFKFVYVAPNVNPRICFDVTGLTFVNKAGNKNDYVKASFKYVDYVSDPTKPYDPANPEEFNPFLTRTTNPGPEGKRMRCTVNIRNSAGQLIEVAYYNKLIQEVVNVDQANTLALKKVNAMRTMLDQNSKTGPVTLRAKKAAEMVSDFNCHGDPFQCITTDSKNPAITKQLGCDTDDADSTINESGHYRADTDCNLLPDPANPDWVRVPNHKVIPSLELANRNIGHDTYRDVLQRIGLTTATAIADASKVAFEGLITNVNQDNPADDPSNPFYEPAFDGEEANRVFNFSQGNLKVLGTLQEPDDSTTDTGGDDSDEVNIVP